MKRTLHTLAASALLVGALGLLAPVSAIASPHGGYHGGGGYYGGGYRGGYGGGYGYRGGYHHGGNWVAGAVVAGLVGTAIYSASRPDTTVVYNDYPAYSPYNTPTYTTRYYQPSSGYYYPSRRVIVEEPAPVEHVYYTPGY